jgi:hypothetical protein
VIRVPTVARSRTRVTRSLFGALAAVTPSNHPNPARDQTNVDRLAGEGLELDAICRPAYGDQAVPEDERNPVPAEVVADRFGG